MADDVAVTEETLSARLDRIESAVFALTERVLARRASEFALTPSIPDGDEELAAEEFKGKPFGGKQAPPFGKASEDGEDSDGDKDGD